MKRFISSLVKLSLVFCFVGQSAYGDFFTKKIHTYGNENCDEQTLQEVSVSFRETFGVEVFSSSCRSTEYGGHALFIDYEAPTALDFDVVPGGFDASNLGRFDSMEDCGEAMDANIQTVEEKTGNAVWLSWCSEIKYQREQPIAMYFALNSKQRGRKLQADTMRVFGSDLEDNSLLVAAHSLVEKAEIDVLDITVQHKSYTGSREIVFFIFSNDNLRFSSEYKMKLPSAEACVSLKNKLDEALSVSHNNSVENVCLVEPIGSRVELTHLYLGELPITYRSLRGGFSSMENCVAEQRDLEREASDRFGDYFAGGACSFELENMKTVVRYKFALIR